MKPGDAVEVLKAFVSGTSFEQRWISAKVVDVLDDAILVRETGNKRDTFFRKENVRITEPLDSGHEERDTRPPT